MAWSASALHRSFITDILGQDVVYDLNLTSGIKAALYGSTPTPNKDATRANAAYNVDQWVTANEKFSAGQWAQGGIVLANPTITNPSTGVIMWDGDDISSGSAASMSDVQGVFLYQDNVTTPTADPGICFNYFGGAQQVTSGTFSILWNASGIARITV